MFRSITLALSFLYTRKKLSSLRGGWLLAHGLELTQDHWPPFLEPGPRPRRRRAAAGARAPLPRAWVYGLGDCSGCCEVTEVTGEAAVTSVASPQKDFPAGDARNWPGLGSWPPFLEPGPRPKRRRAPPPGRQQVSGLISWRAGPGRDTHRVLSVVVSSPLRGRPCRIDHFAMVECSLCPVSLR